MGVLARVLIAHASGPCGSDLAAQGAPAIDAVEERLQALWQTGRAAWPGVDIPAEAFVRHLAEHLPASGAVTDALEAVLAADFYLACGCTLRDPAAIAAFEAHFIAEVSHYLRRRNSLPGFADEVKQTLRESLLVGAGPAPPRICAYNGRGPMGGWLRIATTWAAIGLERARRPSGGPLQDQNVASTAADPELQYLRTHYAGELREALGETLAVLDPHHATILRLYFLEGMRTEEIGKMYEAAPRTVRLWIAQAREAILDQTRQRLQSRLHLAPGEAESLLRVLKDDIDTSISAFFDEGSGADRKD